MQFGDPRRLGAGTARRRAAERSSGDRRGRLPSPLRHRRQPVAGRPLVRDHRQPDHRRRHPRSTDPQRLPDRAHRGQPAQETAPSGNSIIANLTTEIITRIITTGPGEERRRCPASGRNAGRHQIRMSGRLHRNPQLVLIMLLRYENSEPIL